MIAIIDLSKRAKKMNVFDEWNLRIYIYTDDGRLVDEMLFNSWNLNKIKKMKIPIVWKVKPIKTKFHYSLGYAME